MEYEELRDASKSIKEQYLKVLYPRQISLAIGDKDTDFPYKESEKEFKRLEALCKTVGTDWVDFIVFDGGHEFIKDDKPLQKLAKDLWEEL
jgi:hypothetical protein